MQWGLEIRVNTITKILPIVVLPFYLPQSREFYEKMNLIDNALQVLVARKFILFVVVALQLLNGKETNKIH